jgi:ABC-type lipoprotein release transport system permease subunit
MLISVFAFITLTSFSYEYGFNVQPQSGSPPSQGFLLRKPLLNNALPFETIETDILHWLEENSEAALVAPMIQNTPKIGINSPPLSITAIYAPNLGLSFNISGMMGIFPDLEAKVTKIESIIINGRFLSDKDVNGILISEKAGQELQVEPNDTLKL